MKEGIRVLQPTTDEWARSHVISADAIPGAVEDYDEPCPFTAQQIATRAVILQGIVAVASGVDAEPVAQWYHDQGVWEAVSPNERALLLDTSSVNQEAIHGFRATYRALPTTERCRSVALYIERGRFVVKTWTRVCLLVLFVKIRCTYPVEKKVECERERGLLLDALESALGL